MGQTSSVARSWGALTFRLHTITTWKVWPCGNEQADGNTFRPPIVAARAHSCYPQCDIPYPSYKLWQLPPQTELITSCWHSVIEPQFGGQHNCLFSVVSPASVVQNGIQACKMNGPCCLAYWVLRPGRTCSSSGTASCVFKLSCW